MKKIFIAIAGMLLISALASCKKDYECKIPAGTTITNPDGSETVFTEEQRRDCNNCSKDDVKSLEDKMYVCSEK